jgi:hypothetical protein
MKSTDLLDHAQIYAGMGFSVMPLNRLKEPTVKTWKQFQQVAFRDDASLCEWFGPGRKRAIVGIGIICGEVSGHLVCRDYDVAAAYSEWAAKHPDLAARLPTVKTARGFHVYFRWPGQRTIYFEDGELRGEGAYNAAPPSRHETGCVYEWLVPLTAAGLLELDPAAIDFIGKPKKRANGEPLTAATERIERNEPAESTERSETSEHSEHPERLEAISELCEKNPEIANFIEGAIQRTLPTVPGSRNYRIFDFARELKAFPELRDLPIGHFRELVKEWHRRAAPVIMTKDFLTTWADFGTAWPRVKWPKGQGPMELAAERAEAEPSPPCAAAYEMPAQKLLVSLCYQLQLMMPGTSFFLSARTAGVICMVDYTTASRWLRAFCIDGILKQTESGNRTGRRANRYQFLQMPK